VVTGAWRIHHQRVITGTAQPPLRPVPHGGSKIVDRSAWLGYTAMPR
jgi:hypothetical protein